MTDTPWTLRRVHAVSDAEIEALSTVLIDCVDGGSSVSFMHPLTRERADAFWRDVAADVAAGGRALIVAEDDAGICGTVHLVLDMPENQPHRADLVKMLVHRRARRRGLGAALMTAAEAMALDCGRTLLVLDAVTGDAGERLYTRLGWTRVGVIPRYALMPDGRFCSTTYFYRDIGGPGVRESVRSVTPDVWRTRLGCEYPGDSVPHQSPDTLYLYLVRGIRRTPPTMFCTWRARLLRRTGYS